MRVYAVIRCQRLEEYPAAIQRAEALGYDGVSLLELTIPPTLSAVAAALNSTRLSILTAVLVAFPRSPMATAYDAWAIQSLSGGRFQLGLGSQIKSHLKRRWDTEFLPPVPRMREYAEALRAIWRCWQEGVPLDYHGQYYNFNLMIPYYNPGPIEQPRMPLYLAAINKYMCRLAGELFDGHVPGDPVTRKWVQEVMLPNLEVGAKRSGRNLKDLDLASSGFIGCGNTEEDLEHIREGLRQRIGLYATTPDYRKLLELHGWSGILPKLIELSRKGAWDRMGPLVTDQMLEQYAVIGKPQELPGKLREQFGGYAHRIQLDEEWFHGLSDGQVRQLVESIKRL
jgi:probable F420-dependent oxidoreductase